MTKKPTIRRCIGCGQSMDKRALIRVIRTPEGTFELDATGRKNGRGAYLCPNQTCLKRAIKANGLERSFRMAVPQDVYEQLSKELSELETR